ncbi:MAG TPA: c-type cytochrome [Ideonella sp.]|jgi:cytochrome c|nr:c-type cytochrome [Ideonella sp.]
MSSWHSLRLAAGAAAAFACGAAAAATSYAGIGRTAAPAEVAAWDIDVRPDFKGLPRGSGSVAQGQVLWEAKCASCHGVFGESTETFNPLVGGTTAEDVKAGRVASLNNNSFPGRTSLMKLSSVSTLWDYIHRAMPWNQPKTLTTEEVYAVTAYLLHLGGIVPEGFVLADTNIAEVQNRLPNRHGATTDHGLWPGKGLGNGGRPDVRAAACMHDCEAAPKIVSTLPDFARNNHGNLAEQQRLVGPQHGVETGRPGPDTVNAASAPANLPAPAAALLQKHSCTACHGIDKRIVGPGFTEVASKYAGRADLETYLVGKIKSGGQGAWGTIPMPPQALPEADAKTLATWLANGAK